MWKKGKLTDHVHFVDQALYFLMESPEPHESNSRKEKYNKSVLMATWVLAEYKNIQTR